MKMLRKLLELLTPREKRRAAMLLVLVVIMAFLEVVGVASVMPFLAVLANPEIIDTNPYLGAIYNGLGFSGANAFMIFLGGVIFIALVVSISFRALASYALMRFTHMLGHSLAQRLVGGYLAQPYEWFLSRHSADLAQTVFTEVYQVVTGALIPTMQLIASGAVAVSLLVLLLSVNTVLAMAVAVGLGGAYTVMYLLLRRYIGHIGAGRLQTNQERFEAVTEAFGGIKDVKIGGLEHAFLERFADPSLRFARYQAAAQVASQLPRYALEILAFGGIIMAALYLMAATGGLQSALPTLGLYALAGYRLLPALQTVYSEMTKLRFSGPAVEALYADFRALPALPAAPPRATIEPMRLEQAIALEGITYTYPAASRPALDGLNIVVPARTSVGLVGQTGSGKTTTVDIIMGLLIPASGALRVDGVRVTNENARSWRHSIGYVPQQIFLADDTVAANIAFGIPHEQIDLAAVERAARIANLHDFVSAELPQGYDTMVGERGVRLSGGQRQRIGIARALYHRAQVLVLDEATSALDNLTEHAVIEAMGNLGHEITTILIAHRLSTVRHCDRIYLLEKGRIAGEGTYDELVAQNIQFRRMASSKH